MRVFVDADACPVKKEISTIADVLNVAVIYVASYNQASAHNAEGEWKYVDAEKEAADLYIMNQAKPQDVAVTQDIGLASILVKQGVNVLSPRGRYFEEKDMSEALFMRYVSAKERRAGHYGKGPKRFTDRDRERFKETFQKLLSKLAGI
ncbi:YaiI/YqxD family protein [Priestia koreensis]|uniref:YaiI/YqxD family protein n=1 Tax=Priestia koreensis TaxID=284581 RepID=UPI00316ACC96